jgi:hypothetical protein
MKVEKDFVCFDDLEDPPTFQLKGRFIQVWPYELFVAALSLGAVLMSVDHGHAS